MPLLHRVQWIDAQIRAGRYPNTKAVADQFEISRRQALRDLEYMRDSLGAPLEYIAEKRGYGYSTDTFILPGTVVTAPQRHLLRHLASYYQHMAAQTADGDSMYREMAHLFRRLSDQSGHGENPSVRSRLPLVPFRGLVTFSGPVLADPTDQLRPYWRGFDESGSVVLEFHQPVELLKALFSVGRPFQIVAPDWLRRRLRSFLGQLNDLNQERTDMTRHVTPPLLSSDIESQTQRRSSTMTKKSVQVSARLAEAWNSYAGAAYGVVKAAELIDDMSLRDFMCLTGAAFRLIVHENCDVSGPTTYYWEGEHVSGLDRIGVLSEMYFAMPGDVTYDIARRRAVDNLKRAIDSGVGAVLWGVDTGEFGVAYGYDDTDGVLLVSGVEDHIGQGSAPILYENVAKTFVHAPVLHYQIPVGRTDYDRERAYRSSLNYYVQQMEREHHVTPVHHSGFKGYEAWKNSLMAGNYQSFGLRYITYAYRESKEAAAGYADYLSKEWNGLPGLAEVAGHFQNTHQVYEQMMAVLGQKPSDGPELLHTDVKKEQAAALVTLVEAAEREERQAVAILKKAIAK